AESGPREPAPRSVFQQDRQEGPGKLAQGRVARRGMRRRRADVQLGALVLRQLPLGPPPGQPAPGAARLLRRAHLRARRPAARQVLPRRLAGAHAPAARRLSRARLWRRTIQSITGDNQNVTSDILAVTSSASLKMAR